MYKKTRSAGFGAEVKRRILLGTYVLSSGYYDAYYLRAMKVRTLVKSDYDEALKKVDVLLTPTVPDTAFKIGQNTDDPLAMYLGDICTVTLNLTGLPGMNICCGYKDGRLSACSLFPRLLMKKRCCGLPIRLNKIVRIWESSYLWGRLNYNEIRIRHWAGGPLWIKDKNKDFLRLQYLEFGAEPNTHVCPVCLGLPGVLPVLNKKSAAFCH